MIRIRVESSRPNAISFPIKMNKRVLRARESIDFLIRSINAVVVLLETCLIFQLGKEAQIGIHCLLLSRPDVAQRPFGSKIVQECRGISVPFGFIKVLINLIQRQPDRRLEMEIR